LLSTKNSQRILALTASGLTVVHLARVPLRSGTIAAASGSSYGGATLTIRGSGFKAGVTATIGGKSAAVTLIDMNTLRIVAPALNPGKYGIVISNSDGEAASLDTSFTANERRSQILSEVFRVGAQQVCLPQAGYCPSLPCHSRRAGFLHLSSA